MEAAFERLASALGDRYGLERELGRGRHGHGPPAPAPTHHGRAARAYQRPASHKPGATTFPSIQNLIFGTGDPTCIFQRYKLAP